MGCCEKWLMHICPPLARRHSDISWVFHASEPSLIVTGKIANSPPNLNFYVCFQKNKASDIWGNSIQCVNNMYKKIEAYKQINKRNA